MSIVHPGIVEEGAEPTEELCVDHLASSLPEEVGVVQRVVLVQPEDCNNEVCIVLLIMNKNTIKIKILIYASLTLQSSMKLLARSSIF